MTLQTRVANLFGFGPGQTRVWKLSVRQWVWILVGCSAALQVYIAILSAQEFHQGSYDLGVTIQGLSNVGHGRFFWSTGNYLHHGTVSVMDSHFSWVYLAMYPIYTVAPGQTTLFVVQAVVIAIAAVPLERLAAEASGSPKRGLLTAGIYLVWAPIYAGMPNSFHLEAFLPVLFFSLVLVWVRKQYALGLVLAVFAGFTVDLAPFFTALIAIIFLTYPLQAAIRARRKRSAPNPSGRARGWTSRISATSRRLARQTVAFARVPEVRACLGLLALSIAVFFSVRYLEAHLTTWIGIPGTSLSLLRDFGSFSNVPVRFDQKVWFWVVMGATVGFLPLLYPRILILLVPWIGYTFLQGPVGWYTIPSHYDAITAVPFFLGLALGIGVLPLSRPTGATDSTSGPTARPVAEPSPHNRSMMSGASNGAAVGGPSAAALPPPSRRGAARRRLAKWTYVGSLLVVCGVVVANVGINPVNPLTAGLIASARNPLFLGGGDPYDLTPDPVPGYGSVVQLAAQIPSHASLMFQSQFYPLVGTDPNAYGDVNRPSTGYAARYPFNDTHLPEYVLADMSNLKLFDNVVGNLSVVAWNGSIYGVVGWVQSTRFGSVFLFERNYIGPTLNFGPISYPTVDFLVGSTLKPGPAGRLGVVVKTRAITSAPDQTGRMWNASYLRSLPAGKYKMVVDLRTNGTATACTSAATNDSPLLDLTGYPPHNSPVVPEVPIVYANVTCGGWHHFSTVIDLLHPVGSFVLAGTRPSSPVPLTLSVASVDLIPV